MLNNKKNKSRLKISPIAHLVRILSNFDFLHARRKINKRIIYEAVTEALNKADFPMESFLEPYKKHELSPGEYRFRVVLTLWSSLWQDSITAMDFPDWDLILILDKFQHDISRGGQEYLNQKLIRKMEKKNKISINFTRIAEQISAQEGAGNPLTARRRKDLITYLQDAASCLAYFHYKNFTGDNVKKARRVIKPLVNLLNEGYGMPYIVSTRKARKIEVRLPVWDARKHIEVIEDVDAPWLGVGGLGEKTDSYQPHLET